MSLILCFDFRVKALQTSLSALESHWWCDIALTLMHVGNLGEQELRMEKLEER